MKTHTHDEAETATEERFGKLQELTQRSLSISFGFNDGSLSI